MTLEKAVQICQTYEYAQEQLKTMTLTTGSNMGAVTAAVNFVDRRQGSSQGTKPKGTKHGGPARGSHTSQTKSKTTKPGETEQKQCGNCGKEHALISNIRDYLSNSVDILSYFVLDLECKTVVCCGLNRFMLILP